MVTIWFKVPPSSQHPPTTCLTALGVLDTEVVGGAVLFLLFGHSRRGPRCLEPSLGSSGMDLAVDVAVASRPELMQLPVLLRVGEVDIIVNMGRNSLGRPRQIAEKPHHCSSDFAFGQMA